MAHAYTIAISRLESLLGKSMQVVPHDALLPQAKERSLAALEAGDEFLKELLKRPANAWKQFHKGTDLLRDWDTFNMKRAALIAKQSETDPRSEGDTPPEEHKLRTRKTFNETPAPTTPSPSKKKKISLHHDGSSSNLSEGSVRNPSSVNSSEHFLEIQAARNEQGRLRALLENVNQREIDLQKRVSTLECEASDSDRLAAR